MGWRERENGAGYRGAKVGQEGGSELMVVHQHETVTGGTRENVARSEQIKKNVGGSALRKSHQPTVGQPSHSNEASDV